jgi:hypothetical protein
MPAPQQALSAALACWNAGDLGGYLSLYDEGIQLHGYSQVRISIIVAGSLARPCRQHHRPYPLAA